MLRCNNLNKYSDVSGFQEFYNQRRRWTPSTMANIMDILRSWRVLIKKNENFSALYVLYQLLLFVSSLLTPATIFLLIVGAFNTAFKVSAETRCYLSGALFLLRYLYNINTY